MNNQSFFGQQIQQNRLERPLVEKRLWIRGRNVRFAAEGSLNDIKKQKDNGFGRQVITHASRPEGSANSYWCLYFCVRVRLFACSSFSFVFWRPNAFFLPSVYVCNYVRVSFLLWPTLFCICRCAFEFVWVCVVCMVECYCFLIIIIVGQSPTHRFREVDFPWETFTFK